MPFKSEAQRKYMYAKHPEIARRWTKEHISVLQKLRKKSKKRAK